MEATAQRHTVETCFSKPKQPARKPPSLPYTISRGVISRIRDEESTKILLP